MKRGKAMSKKKKGCKVFFDDKKLLAVSITLFLILAIALAFVNVPQNSTITGRGVGDDDSQIKSSIKGMFTNWEGGDQFDANIIKYIFWFTILVLVVGVLSFLHFPENKFLQFLIGLGVSFLSVIFITPGELYNILAEYTALALTLTSVLPFFIMLGASSMLLSTKKIKKMSAGKVILQVALWGLWVCFLAYRLIKLWAVKGIAVEGEEATSVAKTMIFQEGGIVLIIVFVLSLLVLIFNKWFIKMIHKVNLNLRIKKAEIERTEAVEGKKTERAKAEANE